MPKKTETTPPAGDTSTETTPPAGNTPSETGELTEIEARVKSLEDENSGLKDNNEKLVADTKEAFEAKEAAVGRIDELTEGAKLASDAAEKAVKELSDFKKKSKDAAEVGKMDQYVASLKEERETVYRLGNELSDANVELNTAKTKLAKIDKENVSLRRLVDDSKALPGQWVIQSRIKENGKWLEIGKIYTGPAITRLSEGKVIKQKE